MRHEVVQLAGPKLKKLLSARAPGLATSPLLGHDHVIRFHSLKGLPVSKENCVFLRERPQCTGDVLRKSPSIFQDLIRYRGQMSPLLELERNHLALVLTAGLSAKMGFMMRR